MDLAYCTAFAIKIARSSGDERNSCGAVFKEGVAAVTLRIVDADQRTVYACVSPLRSPSRA